MVKELHRRHMELVDKIEAAGPRGIATSVLLDWIYGGLKQPPCARKALHVRVHRINRRILQDGQKIAAIRDGCMDGYYRLITIGKKDDDHQVQYVYRRPKPVATVRPRT